MRNNAVDKPVKGCSAVRWVGHATCVIDVDQLRIITDPLLRYRVGHLVRWERLDKQILAGIDAVFLSHAHRDHLDIPSLKWLVKHTPKKQLRIIAPPDTASIIKKQLGKKALITQANAGDQLTVDNVPITITYANHDGSRSLLRKSKNPSTSSIGFISEGVSRIYFPGDTDIFPEMSRFAPIDVALLPIGGWWKTLGPRHLNPARASEAAKLLQAKQIIPIHWGTIRPFFTAKILQPLRFAPVTELRNSSACEVKVLMPGEKTMIMRD